VAELLEWAAGLFGMDANNTNGENGNATTTMMALLKDGTPLHPVAQCLRSEAGIVEGDLLAVVPNHRDNINNGNSSGGTVAADHRSCLGHSNDTLLSSSGC
jgi:hypothetical protein